MREIEIDEAPPSREVGALNRNVDIAAADIVDENIDGRRLREHPPAKILACRGLGDVGGEGPGLALAFTHLAGGPGEGVGVARDKKRSAPASAAASAITPAEAAAAARDQKALAVQSEAIEHGHVAIPVVLACASFSGCRSSANRRSPGIVDFDLCIFSAPTMP